ncbi:TATE DNA transposon [Trypanosoma theileri]|uniref:TATE DNA transposon n=1 Tax=Trypanosoma theileri TaxID=67003 RepID=A0A1X0NK72_9TRYP|nr:TATE DNA transposon [Trypanosoma theileri]ORC85164.1 TATE DNA transposon [Trypanosoma theileri]
MIDNILIAAKEGQEEEFVRAVRQVLLRIRAANLLTSPDREELLRYTDEELLRLAEQNNVFLGEEYMWNGTERVVRNSVKTVAKLMLSSTPKFYISLMLCFRTPRHLLILLVFMFLSLLFV